MPSRIRISGYVIETKPVVVRTNCSISCNKIAREVAVCQLYANGEWMNVTIDKIYLAKVRKILDLLHEQDLSVPNLRIYLCENGGMIAYPGTTEQAIDLLQAAFIKLEEDLSFAN
jgi:hypothetical protein